MHPTHCGMQRVLSSVQYENSHFLDWILFFSINIQAATMIQPKCILHIILLAFSVNVSCIIQFFFSLSLLSPDKMLICFSP